MSHAHNSMLKDRRVLVVEDEPLVAMLLEDILAELGMVVLETKNSLEDGLAAAADEQFDIAVLDMNLNGERSFPIADVLNARGIPFVFASGYTASDHSYCGAVFVEKPYRQETLVAALERTMIR